MSRVDEALAAARARLTASPTAGLDAELLLAATLGRRRTWLHAWPEVTLSPGQAEHFDEWIARRAAGEPIAYLLGEREFWSLTFAVSPDVLIPRPETEGLVSIALDHLRTTAVTEPRILDLGTGSGCVALALAHERPDARVTAVEAAGPTLEIARANAARHGIVNVEFIEGNWFAPLGSRRFDVIVSNPPYIATGDPHLTAGDVRFEPVTALDGGPDGLHGLREIAAGAPHHLPPGGLGAVEHGADQADAVVSLFTAEGLTTVETHADDAGLPRITAARAPG
jgi:release factor glutamine methyltransferase